MLRHQKISLFYLIVVGVLILGAVAVYMVRAPIVIAVDDGFEALYGKRRANLKRTVLSFYSIRRIKLAKISRDADLNAVGLAIASVSKNPYIVIFPERYQDGAERYAEILAESGNTKTRVISISSGESAKENIGRVESIRVDRETDLYRAGVCAAVLSKGGFVEVFSGIPMPLAHQRAFAAGLEAGGNKTEPVFKRRSDTLGAGASCVVLVNASGQGVLNTKNTMPLILFSWIDPVYTPSNAAVLFDDSPIAVAVQVLEHNFAPVSETYVPNSHNFSLLVRESLLSALQMRMAH